jgi:hypothetical protein
VNHTLVMWGSLAVFGALAAGDAVVAVRAASGVPLPEAARAASALLVFGGALFALRDPDRFAPPTPWLAYVAAAGAALYAAVLLG